jgi:hypothetical protein
MAAAKCTSIVLTAGDAGLELTLGPSGWTIVAIRRAGAVTTLGADRFGDLARRLLSFLEDPPVKLRWVLTFSETHSSAYGVGGVDRQALLRFQDKNATFFDELTLSDSDRQVWIERLELALRKASRVAP